jgi:L-cysteine/cystine lyase
MLHALEIVRSGMPAARHAVYLNAGTWGPLPTRAADAMRARIDVVESRGRIGSSGYAEFSRIREAARAALAESMSSDPERIALTHSTSGGMNLVLGGLAFAPGDEIVTTDNEHAGLLEPLAALTRRSGVVVRVAEALHGSDPLDAVSSLIGPRTRLVALSHALWANGRVLPLAAISEAAHAAGAPVLVDGAQGVGAIDVDPAALGVDAYAGPGQKWLCGPNGVGFLWVAEGFEERFEVAAPSYYTRDFRSEG